MDSPILSVAAYHIDFKADDVRRHRLMNRRDSSLILICPGMHDPALTDSFVQCLLAQGGHALSLEYWAYPAQDYPAFSGFHIRQFLQQRLAAHHVSPASAPPLIFISFSAGVVGAIAAAQSWQSLGGTVQAFLALDGWGVPLAAEFPFYRLSHDFFTHWSSRLLGGGTESFYADPPVEHLDLWRSPDKAKGWHIHKKASGQETRSPTTAAGFITDILERHSRPTGYTK